MAQQARQEPSTRGSQLSVKDVSSASLMARHTLFAYVDGDDVEDVAPEIRRALEDIVGSRRWTRPTWMVDQVHPRESSMRTGDFPAQDLGLNHELPDRGAETPGWFDDVEQLAMRLGELASATECEFVLGWHDNESGLGEDVFWIKGSGLDISQLRAILGACPPSQAS